MASALRKEAADGEAHPFVADPETGLSRPGGQLSERAAQQTAVAKRAVERLQADIDALRKVYTACEARVLQEKNVPMSEEVLGLSDPDAGFISKGQREPVIGYNPQLARSGAGFVTGLLLPQGNAPDSNNLVPMIEDVIARTKVTPKVVSVDDGYASAKNKKALEERKSWSRCIPFRGCETRTSNRRLKFSRPFRGHLVPCKGSLGNNFGFDPTI